MIDDNSDGYVSVAVCTNIGSANPNPTANGLTFCCSLRRSVGTHSSPFSSIGGVPNSAQQSIIHPVNQSCENAVISMIGLIQATSANICSYSSISDYSIGDVLPASTLSK